MADTAAMVLFRENSPLIINEITESAKIATSKSVSNQLRDARLRLTTSKYLFIKLIYIRKMS